MNIAQRALNLMNSFLKSYGPSGLKKRLWDREFSSAKWDFIDDTAGDCVYSHVEKHAHSGDILDLGCGPGNTANELAANSYRSYLGIDISEAALAKAGRRTEATGRKQKNRFAQGDFLAYDPKQKFDVVLFRESMYHVPMGKIKSTLDWYTSFLKDTGVFVVRMGVSNSDRPKAMFDIMENEFEIIEKSEYQKNGGNVTVLVFRPRKSPGQSV